MLLQRWDLNVGKHHRFSAEKQEAGCESNGLRLSASLEALADSSDFRITRQKPLEENLLEYATNWMSFSSKAHAALLGSPAESTRKTRKERGGKPCCSGSQTLT